MNTWGALLLAAVGMNDISTDLKDPPPLASGAAFAYAKTQQAAYPDLKPVHSPLPPAAMLKKAGVSARALGWQVLTEGDGRVEAVAEVRMVGATFDVVVRVRPDGTGSVVDVRSRSRSGRGDLGANARRVRKYLDLVAKDSLKKVPPHNN